jgi:small subunit ribosomal protein S2
MVDTNSDPDVPDFIIPCNDDSARTIQLVASQVADAIIEGAAEREAHNEEELMEAAAIEVKDVTEEEVEETKTKLRSRRKKQAEPTLEPSDEETKEEASEEE